MKQAQQLFMAKEAARGDMFLKSFHPESPIAGEMAANTNRPDLEPPGGYEPLVLASRFKGRPGGVVQNWRDYAANLLRLSRSQRFNDVDFDKKFRLYRNLLNQKANQL